MRWEWFGGIFGKRQSDVEGGSNDKADKIDERVSVFDVSNSGNVVGSHSIGILSAIAYSSIISYFSFSFSFYFSFFYLSHFAFIS